jgi:Polyketide cyclase / dehydrase and lipid transport
MVLKAVIIVGVALAALIGIVIAVGLSLPKAHMARAERLVLAPAAVIAARLRTVADYSTWRPGVTVENIEGHNGTIAYTEISDGDRIAFALTEPEPGRRFVSVMTDASLPFGGQWKIELEPRGDATLVRIQEDGEIRSPVFRFFARFVFGYEMSMRKYLDALEASAASS